MLGSLSSPTFSCWEDAICARAEDDIALTRAPLLVCHNTCLLSLLSSPPPEKALGLCSQENIILK